MYTHYKKVCKPFIYVLLLYKKIYLTYCQINYTGESMQLNDWIRKNGYNYRSFGKEIGINFRNIEKWARGETLPRYNYAKQIFDFTNNEVTGHDFYEKQIQRNQTGI
tara:strand:+ start:580 stop:900 length:321 start_codon:yes stop_codon:yes gene_type:complete